MSSPAVSTGTVYIGARDGFLYALRADSGKLVWKFDHEISWVISSPAVQDSMVYAGTSDGLFVQAVDTRTGLERWRPQDRRDSLVIAGHLGRPCLSTATAEAGSWRSIAGPVPTGGRS
jgi:outer membrane protein assembly factor BamB